MGGETTIEGFHKSSKLRCIDLRSEAIEAAGWRFSTTALYGLCAFFYRFHEESNGVIALADIIGDETYRKFFVEITNWDCTK